MRWKSSIPILVRLSLYAICAVLAGFAAFYGEPLVRKNTDAILILTTVFTVFAGFLVAIITILGDPALGQSEDWKALQNKRESVEAQLIIHVYLFVFYLIALGLLFAGVVAREAKDVPELVKVWIDRGYLFFGVLSFLLTFGLAKSMLKFQLARYDAAIRKRRKDAGLKD